MHAIPTVAEHPEVDSVAVPRTLRAGAPRLPARLLRLVGDERLVEYVRAGSTPAFEVLYDRHHRAVLAFCRHMLGSVEEAEDAVQHTFMAAYDALRASDRAIRLRPWLYAIARNRCLSILRARRETPSDTVAEPATEHLASEVQRREDLRDLLRDVAALPDDQRAALVLAELGDVSHDEIAEVLGCQREKVKALVFQARTSLNASRSARETSCAEIREQLANLRGGSLRRNTVRRHLRECAGCRDFRAAVREQRRALAVVLPVAPSLGLKQAVLGSVAGTSAAAGGGAAIAAKALVAVVVAGGGATATVEAVRDPEPVVRPVAPPAVAPAAPAAAAAGGHAPAHRHESHGAPAEPRAAAPVRIRDRPATTPVAPREPAAAQGHGAAAAPGHVKPRGAAAAPGHVKPHGAETAPGQLKPPGEPAAPDNPKATAPGQLKPRESPAAPGQLKAPGERADPGNGKATAPGQLKPRGNPAAPGQAERAAPAPAKATPPATGQATAPGQVKQAEPAAPDERQTPPGQAEPADD